MENGGNPHHANRAGKRHPETLRLPYAIRLGGINTDRFNRRMRKTARPVVWEGWRAQSRHLDPIVRMQRDVKSGPTTDRSNRHTPWWHIVAAIAPKKDLEDSSKDVY